MNNRIHGAFDTVHAEDALKRKTKTFITGWMQTTTKVPRFQRLAIIFACSLIVMLGFGGWNMYITPVSAISVDINPSVELGINRFDRVVTIESYNDDGAKIIAFVDLKNLKYTDALTVLFDSEGFASYANDNALVSITIVGNSIQEEEEMYSLISSCCYYSGVTNIECCAGNHTMVDEAHDAGLSFGKYHTFLELQALDPNITIEDIKGLNMKQIHDRIDELTNSLNLPQNGSNENGHGNQYQGNPDSTHTDNGNSDDHFHVDGYNSRARWKEQNRNDMEDSEKQPDDGRKTAR